MQRKFDHCWHISACVYLCVVV